MERWAFKTGCILMGWGPVEAAIELRTSIDTIMKLEEGPMGDVLAGEVVRRARDIFQDHKLAIYPHETRPEEPVNNQDQPHGDTA